MTDIHSDRAPGIDRRRVLHAAAWTAPAIAVAGAAPALAATGTPTMSVAYDPNSYRGDAADLNNGTPGNGGRAAISLLLTVAGGTVDSVTCTITTNGAGNGIQLLDTNALSYDNPNAAGGPTTWAANNGSLAADGWSNPGPGTSQSKTFTRPLAIARSTVPFRVVLSGLQNGDSPLTFLFSSPDAASTSVTVSRLNAPPTFLTSP